MVVALDSYLWSKRSDELAPELRAIVENEAKAKSSSTASSSGADAGRQRSGGGDATPSSAQPLHPTLEDPLVHWGTLSRMAGARCPCCTLPLSAAVGGVAVFRCGHSFCTTCVPENACPLCYTARQSQELLGMAGAGMFGAAAAANG